MSDEKPAEQAKAAEAVKIEEPPKKEREKQGALHMAGYELEGATQENTLMPKFKTFGEIFEYCNWVASSEIIPAAYKNRPADVFMAAQYGHEIGLPFMTAIQNIAIIGGRPALPSDIKLAMVRGRKILEWKREAGLEEIKETGLAWCEMKRVGEPEIQRHTFSIDDAKMAGLWERRGQNNYPTPWVTHKFRMLMLKARDMCLRDLFGDVYKGLHSVEEARDIQILEAEQSPQAQIERQSQPETKGKEILDKPVPVLTGMTSGTASTSETLRPPAASAPAEEPKPAEPSAGASAATLAFAQAVDRETQRLRTLPGGNAALLKIWTQFKIPQTSFAKGLPSALLSSEQLDLFSIEIEKILAAIGPK